MFYDAVRGTDAEKGENKEPKLALETGGSATTTATPTTDVLLTSIKEELQAQFTSQLREAEEIRRKEHDKEWAALRKLLQETRQQPDTA